MLELLRLFWTGCLYTILHQVTFSRSIRDVVVLSIQEKVRQSYTDNVLVKRLNCFAAEVLNTITDVTVGEICVLFQPQTDRDTQLLPPPLMPPAEAPSVLEDKTMNQEPNKEPDSAVVLLHLIMLLLLMDFPPSLPSRSV
eukprot:superscaffoldBa00000476_g5033